MTKVTVYRKGGAVVKFIAQGHTNFAESGSDIVCAAVSTLLLTAVNGLTEVVGIAVGYEVRDGYVECVLPAELEPNAAYGAQVLLESTLLSLKNLDQNYVSVCEVEV